MYEMAITSMRIHGGPNGLQPSGPVPVLIFLQEPKPGPFWELSDYLARELAQGSICARTARSICKTLQQFIAVKDVMPGNSVAPAEELSDLLATYCFVRISGTQSLESSACGHLKWRPIAPSTARSEFRHLIRFFKYCQETFGQVELRSKTYQFSETRFVRKAFTARRYNDFLSHLNTQRDRWARLLNKTEHDYPKFLRVSNSPPANWAQKAIAGDELAAIIDNEPNPVFRSLFILYGFGGLRLSEPLHFWQIDILPSSSWQLICSEPSTAPLVLRCNPVHSTFLGSFSDRSETRREYLARRYKLQPRNLLPDDDILYAGWKGTKSLHKQFLCPTFLLAPPKIIRSLAEALSEVSELHQAHRTSSVHPYFFCNLNSRRAECFGAPTKISNVQDAWERAVKRVGLEPRQDNRNIHACRHLYKETAVQLGFDRETIQDLLGHSSIESQRQYGNAISGLLDGIHDAYRSDPSL